MKAPLLALLLAGPFICCPPGGAQTPAPTPKTPDLNQLFQFQPSPDSGKPRFKLQVPNGKLFRPPQGTVVESPLPGAKQDIDPGMILKPRGFKQQPSRPAPSTKIYPDLKIMPIEIATLDLAPAEWPQAKLEPIPRAWSKAKIEPIPTTWKDFRAVPIDAGAGAEQP
jgi:hypothetical protein